MMAKEHGNTQDGFEYVEFTAYDVHPKIHIVAQESKGFWYVYYVSPRKLMTVGGDATKEGAVNIASQIADNILFLDNPSNSTWLKQVSKRF